MCHEVGIGPTGDDLMSAGYRAPGPDDSGLRPLDWLDAAAREAADRVRASIAAGIADGSLDVVGTTTDGEPVYRAPRVGEAYLADGRVTLHWVPVKKAIPRGNVGDEMVVPSGSLQGWKGTVVSTDPLTIRVIVRGQNRDEVVT
jgi:hypothetical protein